MDLGTCGTILLVEKNKYTKKNSQKSIDVVRINVKRNQFRYDRFEYFSDWINQCYKYREPGSVSVWLYKSKSRNFIGGMSQNSFVYLYFISHGIWLDIVNFWAESIYINEYNYDKKWNQPANNLINCIPRHKLISFNLLVYIVCLLFFIRNLNKKKINRNDCLSLATLM